MQQQRGKIGQFKSVIDLKEKTAKLREISFKKELKVLPDLGQDRKEQGYPGQPSGPSGGGGCC